MSLHYMRAMDDLNGKLTETVNLVEQQVSHSITSISKLNKRLMFQVIENDNTVNSNEIKVEEECLKILALYQPVATDLRFIITILKINNDMKRIADHASNVAEDIYFLLSADIIRHAQ